VTRWLYGALAAQLIFFGAWGARLLTSHRDVAVVWLATEPVDPRDLLSGNYVALRYSIARTYCDVDGTTPVPVWIELAPIGGEVTTADGTVTVSSQTQCRAMPPEPGEGGHWIRGTLEPRGDRITFGIERMFVAETSPLRTATTGSVVAKVALNDGSEPRLLDLVPIEKEPTP
jgi:uncharacterized membrane-anchored protein